MRITRLLHATDFSAASRPALRLAHELARAFKSELVLCHAYQRPTPLMAGDVPVPPRVLDDVWAADRKEALRRLGALVRAARGAGVRASPLLVEGPPAAAIVRAASRKRVGLLILGIHGRTGVPRMLLGSVAERVVRTARCPVVTVRPRR